jgi:hypothetical protein
MENLDRKFMDNYAILLGFSDREGSKWYAVCVCVCVCVCGKNQARTVGFSRIRSPQGGKGVLFPNFHAACQYNMVTAAKHTENHTTGKR